MPYLWRRKGVRRTWLPRFAMVFILDRGGAGDATWLEVVCFFLSRSHVRSSTL
jgi:hypothetical protein